ncbi:MAG: amidase [Mycobacterium leprae]
MTAERPAAGAGRARPGDAAESGGKCAGARGAAMGDVHDLTLLEQAAAIRRREVSPVELVEHYLARIERLDPRVGAFVTVTPDPARAAAREAERALLDRAVDVDTLPPLHGVPLAIKDLNYTAGVRTTLGSSTYAEFVPMVDDFVVAVLRAAGTISVGKTNVPEFGLPCYTEPDVAPPARTPWDLDRSAGGSSGGAGAAVAAGLVPAAQGSDGAGSIRIPASACGLVGLKPARGRISGGPLAANVTGLSVNGPLARTVRDAAALLDAMAGPMPGDPFWAPPPPPGATFLAACERPPRALRIGRTRTPVVADTDLHPQVVAAWEAASGLLEELGHAVEDVPPAFTPDVVKRFETVWSVSATLTPVDPAEDFRLRPLTRWLRARGRAVSGPEFARALADMQLAARAAVAASAAYDAVLMPTLAAPPARVGELRDDGDPARDFANQKAFTPFTSVANVTGQPAVSLPLHWTADGLPVGVMLLGRPAGEAGLLSLAAQVEAARPWHERRPAVWSA